MKDGGTTRTDGEGQSMRLLILHNENGDIFVIIRHNTSAHWEIIICQS